MKCNKIFSKLKLRQQDIDYVKSLTRKQSNCLMCHHVVCRLIITSKVYDVLHTFINSRFALLIESICKKATIANVNITALTWGIDNEKNAITQYTEFQRNQGNKNFKVNSGGLLLYKENSFLGASTDVLAIQKKKMLEVKCSFCHRETLNTDEAVTDNDFF